VKSPVINLSEFISTEEIGHRGIVDFLNFIIWIVIALLLIASNGVYLVIYFIIIGINRMLSELDVRKIRAIGVTVSERQFPAIFSAFDEICNASGIKKKPTLIVVNQSEHNAFAVRYANKNVIVLYSALLETSLVNIVELKFILGHEIAHIVLSRKARDCYEVFKPAFFRAAREMTCDNFGMAVSRDSDSALNAMRKLPAGKELASSLDIEALKSEADEIGSGITGWLLGWFLSHPPVGKRISQAVQFAEKRHIENNQPIKES
jgi:Zn-dependent protease with chaperone function